MTTAARDDVDGAVTPPAAGHPRPADPPPSDRPTVLVRRLDPELPSPVYALPGDAGADIVSAVDLELPPGARAVVPTGLALAIPDGYAAFVHPRSGLAARAGLSFVNTPGTIDAGYRGELKVIVINHDRTTPIRLARGERIAQLVVQRVEHAQFVEVAELPAAVRGERGYGSTGNAALLAGDATPLVGDAAPQDRDAVGAGRDTARRGPVAGGGH